MKVCILGGGNIGMCLLGEISRIKGFDVILYTSKSSYFDQEILVEDTEKNIIFKSGNFEVTSNLEKAVKGAEFILCTVPAFLRKELITNLSPFIGQNTFLGFFPAYGGAELFSKELIEKGITIFGLQKVPYVARTKKIGKIAGLWSKKNKLYIASLPHSKAENVKFFIENTLQVHCDILPNYLASTLLPGNPLLHTSGSYIYLNEFSKDHIFDEQIYYYRKWNNECSIFLCKMSDEMKNICDSLPLDLSGVQTIQDYYDSSTPEILTEKFHTIPSFYNLTLPMKKTEKGFIVDYESRFYKEDIPFGLCAIKSLALITNVDVPTIDKVIHWYEKIANVQYYTKENKLGTNINETISYQLNGIKNKEDIKRFYQR